MQMMQAAKAERIQDISYPVVVQPKLDGIRAVKADGRMMSRQGKPIPNATIQRWCDFIPEGFEGELVATTDELMPMNDISATNSVVTAQDGGWNFRFYVFDICHPRWEFKEYMERFARIRQFCFGADDHRLVPVPSNLVDNEDVARRFYEKYCENYEGAMFRKADGFYKRGRATLKEGLLIKMKPWQDLDAIVVGYHEEVSEDGQGKQRLGALECEWGAARFKVGTGFSADQREDFWSHRGELVGSLVSVKFQNVGSGGAPRFPVFRCLRKD